MNYASRAIRINYGSYALKALTPDRVTGKQIEAARVALTRHMKRQGRVWTRVFPNIPVSKKPIEVRMGKGKGNPEFFACRVKPGRILFEVDGVSEQIAKEALYKASAKLPIKTKTIKRFAFYNRNFITSFKFVIFIMSVIVFSNFNNFF